MKTLLDSARDRLGSTPRSFPRPLVRRVVGYEKGLGAESARRLLLEGQLVWGVIAVKPDTKREPARSILVYPSEEAFDPLLVRVLEVAQAVQQVAETNAGEELNPLRAWLGGARLYHRKTELPPLLTRGHPIRAAVADVDRRELPRPIATLDILPIFVHDAIEGAIVLPKEFWSHDFRRAWLELRV